MVQDLKSVAGTGRRVFPTALALILAAALLGACGSSSTPPRGVAGFEGHTVTFALQPGNNPTYIFPLVGSSNFTLVNEDQFEWLSYRPLFWFGGVGDTTAFNPAQSLAYRPTFSIDATGHTVATVRLKKWRWSDGEPVTTRDVEFWIDLLRANKADWGVYVPGAWPDIIRSITYTSSTSFRIVFNARYNTSWLFENEMSQIFPLPQQVWDRTSEHGPVGNYDLTPKGAVAVYNFLNHQAGQLSTYGTNPLWKVVDGPWILSAYDPGTGRTVFTRNRDYPGPTAGQVTTFVEEPFSSSSAEFSEVEAGAVDVGYLPQSDLHALSAVEADGYAVAPWWQWSINFLLLNYANPTAGAVFRQLYLRRAMEELIDQPAYVTAIYGGYAKVTDGPIPTTVPSPYLPPGTGTPGFRYDPAAAAAALAAHGWSVGAGGVRVCTRPGATAADCGPGVRAGTPLRFTLLYPSGMAQLSVEMSALRSALATAGIQLSLETQTYDQVTSGVYSCNAKTGSGCGWQIGADLGWEYYPYPSGEELFETGGSGNAGAYSSPQADAAIQATLRDPGLGPMRHYATFLAGQLPVLWLPTPAYQITVYRKGLAGVVPQDPSLNLYPELWHAAG